MCLKIESACGCSLGNIRRNNEDNFFFDGKYLEMMNPGLREVLYSKSRLKGYICMGVFDGMGGESFGEEASYIAAEALSRRIEEFNGSVVPPEKFLEESCRVMNNRVCAAAESHGGLRMGSTAAILMFGRGCVYVCNLGDSRAFRLRNGMLVQLTVDHTDGELLKSQGILDRKPSLIQHLGIAPDEMIIEPFISKEKLKRGDRYLICSDGLTDMLTNDAIMSIMNNACDIRGCAEKLISRALENGGRDNVTVITVSVA